MTDDPMMTPEYRAKVAVMRKIAIGLGVVVGLIFAVAGVLGYYNIHYQRPAKEVFGAQSAAQDAIDHERNAPPAPPAAEPAP